MSSSTLFSRDDALQMVFDSALNLSLITTNRRGIITAFSRGSELMLGYSATEMVGKRTPLNARDAMRDGGILCVETRNVTVDESYAARHPEAEKGEYVALSVSDTGTGMTPEVVAHLFEPFFTTKERGRGTGLGLCTVFGALKQNRGFVDVRTAPGLGSAFTIFLPRAAENATRAAPVLAEDRALVGSETILLAEDDAGIRAVAVEALSRLGYRVLACADGRSALDASIAAGTIHLLVTDLIMPDMNGKVLATQILSRQPSLKVLFTSGYTADILGRHGMLEPSVEFLAKPYLLVDLARRVRMCLDATPR